MKLQADPLEINCDMPGVRRGLCVMLWSDIALSSSYNIIGYHYVDLVIVSVNI